MKKSKKEDLRIEYEALNDKQAMIEMLVLQNELIEKAEKNKQNTNILVWWFVLLPFLLFFLIFVLGIGGSML
ncbi:hypothetical protein [Psychroflexus aestuariivivens]|uniref:hypothetical protein n=1 Tax=Psychroflexus aestuariivivens TaxID=1795040 RepID=UPI000FD913F3|nr:hypothetical protein [Psychroflexus aestuariivivens]